MAALAPFHLMFMTHAAGSAEAVVGFSGFFLGSLLPRYCGAVVLLVGAGVVPVVNHFVIIN